MGDKKPKSQPVSNSYLPKAGPKSSSGGRNQRRSGVVRNEPDLFTNLLNDRRNEAKERRDEFRRQQEELKRQTIAKNLAFRKSQAEIAKSLVSLPNGPTRDVVNLIIDNFVVVAPDEKTGKFYEPGTSNEIKRTLFAELLILDQLTENQLKNRSAVNNGRTIARNVLSMAYTQLTKAQSAASVQASELVTA